MAIGIALLGFAVFCIAAAVDQVIRGETTRAAGRVFVVGVAPPCAECTHPHSEHWRENGASSLPSMACTAAECGCRWYRLARVHAGPLPVARVLRRRRR